MNNPFISRTDTGREYLTSNCSLNKVKIDKLPLYGVEDEIEGKSVKEIFGAGIIIEDIIENAEQLHIIVEDYIKMDLPKILGERLHQGNACAEAMAKKYGERLGMLLLVLKTSLKENRQARKDWNDSEWEYWANIKNVIFAGGLASGYLGKYLIDTARTVFARAGVKSYNIIRNENSSKIGALGCLTEVMDDDKVHILFDLGQTKIKRVISIEEDNETKLIELESRKSINMEWKVEDYDERVRQANELHEYLVNLIVETYKEAEKYGKVGWEIVISIASYVIDGQINKDRGGYAKLCELGDNYAGILAHALESILSTNIMIQLVHDGTAVALYYKNYDDAVCITMGTALGVGFPEIDLNGKNRID